MIKPIRPTRTPLTTKIAAGRQQSASAIVREHWQRFGRDYFTRHDYEDIDLSPANALIDRLRSSLAGLPGKRFSGLAVVATDDFQYRDPVDGSLSEAQGIRVHFDNGGRVVFRLSGTGTSGATLRVYCDRHYGAAGMLAMDPQQALADVLHAADELAGIRQATGRERPDVIT